MDVFLGVFRNIAPVLDNDIIFPIRNQSRNCTIEINIMKKLHSEDNSEFPRPLEKAQSLRNYTKLNHVKNNLIHF